MADHGLTEQQVEIIRQILIPFADKIERVDLFGSRAQGTYRNNSDIDLVLRGNVGEKTVDHLRTLFTESNLALKVDLLIYERIRKPELKAHIDLVSRPLFTRGDLQKLSREV